MKQKRPLIISGEHMSDGGLDYLRLTGKPKESLIIAEWEATGQALLHLVKKYYPGEEVQPLRFLDYQGWAVKGLGCGHRHDGWMCQASGAKAYDAALAVTHRDRCTRIDLQLTVWAKGSADAEIQGLSEWLRRDGVYTGRGRRPAIEQRCTFGSGDTIYIGSRHGERMARIYDKGAESKDSAYDGAVRFELEYKGDLAERVYHKARGAGFGHGWASSAVCAELALWGLNPTISQAITPMERETLHQEKSTEMQQKEWLYRQVRPTVLRLRKAGCSKEELCAILGLGALIENE